MTDTIHLLATGSYAVVHTGWESVQQDI